MNFGSIKTTTTDDEGIEETVIDKYHQAAVASQYKQYREKHIVSNTQEETSIYLKFAAALQEKRMLGTLIEFDDDPNTRPAFTLDFSPKYKNGYMVITSWTERG